MPCFNKEMRRLQEEMLQLRDDESSDEDLVIPPPTPPHVLVMRESPSSSDVPQRVPEVVDEPGQSPPIFLRGRRLLYGQPFAPIMSDYTSSNDASFSYNSAENPISNEESKDDENEYWCQVRHISSSEHSGGS